LFSLKGVELYTIGQKLCQGGHKQRLYVAEKDLKTKTLYVCSGKDHPGKGIDSPDNKSFHMNTYISALYSETFFTGKPHWIDQAPDELSERKGGRLLVTLFSFDN